MKREERKENWGEKEGEEREIGKKKFYHNFKQKRQLKYHLT